ncbi:MAG: chloride channel protein [Ruminococcaceae bacterium]|nr:chloride channel protein [Oscillospiraceae bacterium]
MKTLKNRIVQSLSYCKVLLKWFVIASVVGAFGGVLGSLFHISIDYATEYRAEFPWLIYFLPLGGLVITLLYRLAKSAGHLDTNRVLDSVRTEEKVPTVMAPLIFVSTVLTHLLGGSAGREGAALQLGGSIGYRLGKVFRLNEKDMHLIVMAGMSAVFSALFGTPLTALFFALEVTTVGVMYYACFVPCAISALAASVIAKLFGLSPVHFEGIVFPELGAGLLGKLLVLTILCALVSILFYTAIHKCEHYAQKWFSNPYLRSFVGGVILVLLTVLVQTRDYNGAGMDVITDAMAGQAKPEAFLLKILFTAITIAAGFKGGEIVPAFFVGSTFGCAVGGLLGLDPGFSAAVGCIALFCGAVNCPIASLFLAFELFGGEALLLFALVCGVSYMMSGYGGLYKSQKIMQSKLEVKMME